MSSCKVSNGPVHRLLNTFQLFNDAPRALKPKKFAGDNYRLSACLSYEALDLNHFNYTRSAGLE